MESGSAAVIGIIVGDGAHDCAASSADRGAGHRAAANHLTGHGAGPGPDQCAIADSIAGATRGQQSRRGYQAGCYDLSHCELSYGLPI
jgi:hypothetical protein